MYIPTDNNLVEWAIISVKREYSFFTEQFVSILHLLPYIINN